MTCSCKPVQCSRHPSKFHYDGSKKFEIMNARDNKIFKVSYLFTQKEVRRGIYYLENSNLIYLLITETATGGIL